MDGDWVYPPYMGALWTPGYWGWGGGVYFWNPGYWGRRVGYYGGINYGFGYFGTGFWGGYWRGGRFFYNGEYNHLGFHDGTVYNHRVEGFDGRPGGAAFARGTVAGLNRRAIAENRGSGINGRSLPSRSTAITPRSTYNSGGARGYSGAPAARSYSGVSRTRLLRRSSRTQLLRWRHTQQLRRRKLLLRWRRSLQWRRWTRRRRWRTSVNNRTDESLRAEEKILSPCFLLY